MSIKIDFNDHTKVLVMISDAQDSERDQREAAREAKLFLYKRDGQWDPYAWQLLDGQFRGTFDMCTPIVDQISGEIEESNFSLKVSPNGGDSSSNTADTMNGLIRNIRNISNAETTFSKASRNNVISGFDAWEVKQDWVDGDSFDQDLFIKHIPNAIDSVWFDTASTMRDRSDANWAIKLSKIPRFEYDERWPDGSGMSIGDDRRSVAYYNKNEKVTVGQLLYRESIDIELVRMTDGSVYEDNDDFKKVQRELANPKPNPATGLTPEPVTIELDDNGEEKRRTRKSWRVWSRMLDGGDWLQKKEKTVFYYIPIIPIYGNFEVIEGNIIYFGEIEKLYDSQRTLNYAMSRDIQDGALSPSPYLQMTDEQIQGKEDQYEAMNTDNLPVRTYNHVEMQPPPFMQGGPQPSTGLQVTISNTKEMIATSSNSFAAGQGNALAAQSGIAGQQQIDQGNLGTVKWFKALEIAVCHTGKVILTNALSEVYSGTRQARILEEDGTSSIVTLNKPVVDENTGDVVHLNDLSAGEYDVVCDYGPAFNSQQKETAQAFLDMAAIDPTIAQQGMDIWLKNLSVPGMDQMAERYREQLLNAGAIPESQLTDEERQKIAQAQAEAANNPPPEDPNMVIARAEEGKAQADLMNAQTKQQVEAANAQNKQVELQIQGAKIQLEQQKFDRASSDKFNVDAAKIQIDQEKQELAQRKQEFDEFMAIAKQQADELNDAFNNLKVMREAMGVDSIVGPSNTDAYKEQAEIITEKQEES